jgi:ABC-2 type transport system permease protein
MFTIYTSAKEQIFEILKTYPPQTLSVIGIDDLSSIFTYNGFFAFSLTYILLATSIMSIYFGINIFAREKITKTSDFLFTKPKKRTKIFTQKLLSCFTALIIVNIFLFISAYYMFLIYGKGSNINTYLLMMFSIFFVEIIFLSLGIFIANLAKKIKNPGGIAIITVFSFFIVNMLQNILKEDKLKYINPFGYFDYQYIIKNNAYDIKFLLLSILISLILLLLSYVAFLKKDIHSQ